MAYLNTILVILVFLSACKLNNSNNTTVRVYSADLMDIRQNGFFS